MADVNVNTPIVQAPTMAPLTRTDDQIMPHIRWVPIGKSNCYLDIERSQSNPIYKIALDIMKHTNFFRAFTASSTIPSIYIQQFWDSVQYDKTAGCYKCQLDEQWFDLTKDTLKDALQITPINDNNAFSSPPTPDALINFVNDLVYPKVVRNLSDVVTNDMFQPRRALTIIIHLCLTGKTLGFERPRALVCTKGTKWEVFGMPILNKLITVDIQGEQYYKKYLEKVAKHQRYLAGEKGSDPDSLASKPAKATKKSKPSAPKADLRLPVIKPASSQQPKPKPTPANRRKFKEFSRCTSRSASTNGHQITILWEISTSSRGSGKGKRENNKMESDEEVIRIDAEVQDEGQAGPNPGEQDEGQAGPNPGDAIVSQP
nr:hypothetical protein [Tanacetum cinerariifolium]